MVTADDSAGAGLRVAIATAACLDGAVDVSMRADADVAFDPHGELPFEDRAVRSIALGDAVVELSPRDQLQLLAECRRVLAAGAELRLVEPEARAVHGQLSHWAELVGLAPLPAAGSDTGWRKHSHDEETVPLVSIVIPAYNARYFGQSIDSALAQTYPRVEIVVCDDSRDGSIEALTEARMRSGHPGLRYVRNPARLGSRDNYEQCLSLARGTHVKFLNDDDVLEPECVSTLLGAFLAVPDLTLATSHRLYIDGDSRILADRPATRPVVGNDVVVNGLSLANAAVMYGLNFIGEPSTFLFRRRDLEACAADGRRIHFDGVLGRGAIDFTMWMRLLVQGNAVFFASRLSRFRRHGEQMQADPAVVARSIDGIRALQHKWIELGLFRLYPPHLLLCRPFPTHAADDWRLEPVRSLPSSPLGLNEALDAWRATPRHSFDFA